MWFLVSVALSFGCWRSTRGWLRVAFIWGWGTPRVPMKEAKQVLHYIIDTLFCETFTLYSGDSARMRYHTYWLGSSIICNGTSLCWCWKSKWLLLCKWKCLEHVFCIMPFLCCFWLWRASHCWRKFSLHAT